MVVADDSGAAVGSSGAVISKTGPATPLDSKIWEDVALSASSEARPLMVVEWYEMTVIRPSREALCNDVEIRKKRETL